MRPVPGTELSTFPLCLGGNVFGWTADEPTSFAVLDAFVAAGGNMIDTADTYSSWQGTPGGESETIIGRWMRARGNRDSLVVATKVGKAPGLKNLRPETIRAAVEGSLRRLQTDRIDVYYAHQDHPDPLDETLEAFDSLVRAGKVRYVGASQFTPERIAESLDLAADKGWTPYAVVQPHYHLMHRDEYERDLAPLLLRREIGSFPYYGLARGFLTGKYRRGGPAVDSVRAAGALAYLDERGERVLAVLDDVAAAHGVTPAAVALGWLLTRPAVVAPIASARTPEQLADLLPLATLELTADDLARLDVASS
jgi:aryl-alcohol dehydrogenase-like predicted oxidoreductase